MDYTAIDKQTTKRLNDICKPISEISFDEAKTNPGYFSYHFLGIRPYSYQFMIFERAAYGVKRLAVCSSRQIGKSISVAVLGLWAAFFNRFPSGVHNNTKVCIISRSDDQAKKLMSEIKKLVNIGDKWMLQTSGKEKILSSELDPYGANNTDTMTFKNGCTVKCFPPTGAIRGETSDLVIVDEAAFVEEEIFREDIEPTVSSTNGIVILTSTPKGQSGLWYSLFDPFDKLSKHEYERLWFPWAVCENKKQKETIQKKLEQAQIEGDTRHFDQEYGAMFTVDEEAFFSSIKVDAGYDEDLSLQNIWNKTPCCLGLDYGMTTCHTVITISTLDTDGRVKLLYQYAYPLNSDDNMIFSDIKELMLKFKIAKIIADDCPQGNSTNQRMKNEGLPIELYNFRSEQATMARDGYNRNTGYYQFRNWLNLNKIKYPKIPELMVEMKALQEVRKLINVSIKKPKGGFDDRIDSFMMSTLPFISETAEGLEAFIVDTTRPGTFTENPSSLREDMVWMNAQKTQPRW